MNWQFSYISWIHLITAIISLQLMFTVLRLDKILGRNAFMWMLILSTYWSFVLAFESAAPSLEIKVVLSSFEYFANMGIPLFFLWYITSYDMDMPSKIRKYFFLFSIIPALTLFLVFTNRYHHLIWTAFSWSVDGNNILVYHHGPVFYIAMGYSMALVIAGNYMMIRYVRRRPGFFKARAKYLLGGSMMPVVTGLLYVLGLSPLAGLDISPMGILVAGFIFFLGIAREQMFDLVPVSHQLMIEKMKDGVIILDNRNFILEVNPSAGAAFQARPGITGLKLEQVFPDLGEYISEELPDQGARNELMIQKPLPSWFEVSRYPLKDTKGRFLGSLLLLHDISHRKRNEAQLRKLAEDLTELNHLKDRIYSIISHDLRNPFNSIMGFSQLLVESYGEFSDTERQKFARNISNASRSAFSLLENLLEWSLMQLGKIPFVPVVVSLQSITAETFDLLRLNAQSKEIRLISRVPENHQVLGDRSMLATIIRNLVSNGIKFTQVGGTIEVFSESGDGYVELTVSDNGVGMTPGMAASLFSMKKIQSTRGTSNEKGTGLGLLLVKEFTEKNGGSVRVESEPGNGSRFIVRFPRYHPS